MKLNKIFLMIIMVIACLGAFLTVLQIWNIGLGWDTYIKIMITMGVLGLLCAFVMVLRSDLGDHKKLKDGNYLD